MGHTSDLSDWVRETLLTWLRIAENKACFASPLGRAAIRIRGLVHRKESAHFHTAVFGIRGLCEKTLSMPEGVSAPCSVRSAAKTLIAELEPLAKYTLPTAEGEVRETLERLRNLTQHGR